MSLAQKIAPHLPYLRRFSRALSGSQKSGDAYVGMVLESLVADNSIFPADISPRLGLYQLFLKVWNSLEVRKFPEFSGDETETVRSLQSITPKARQAFILLAVEGFEPDEIALVLQTDTESVTRLIGQADREMAEQLGQADILIIEDEPLTAQHLKQLVEGAGHYVTGIAATHKEAVRLAEKKRPAVILSDIQLGDDSSGVEAVNEILGKLDVPVIFITGHPHLLLTGDKPEPAFLIPKPFNPDTVKAVISQALFFDIKSRRHAKEPVSAAGR